jgi:dsDNA-specific endonuclease/ATPase MutS2
MTDKEFKRLSRAELIDIIYQFQLQVDKLTEQNKELEQELAETRLLLSNAGNIADVALEINDCFRNTQKVAERYLNEIKAIRDETEAERQKILADAHMEAETIIEFAKNTQDDDDSAIDAILKEYGQSHSDNG